MKMMKRKSIVSLADIKQEQYLLRNQIEATEQELTQSWVYVKSNYKTIVWKEINPFKNSTVLNTALDFIQPGLLPVITEVVKGSVKGNPINLKVLGQTAKYAIASLGISWLRKWLDKTEASDKEAEADSQLPIE